MSTVITPGSLLIKSMLPEKAKKNYDPAVTLDKKAVSDLIVSLLKTSGPEAFPAISKLSHLFFGTATEIGSSTPLLDYYNDSDERRARLDEFEHQVAEILNSDKPKQQKLNELNQLAAKVAEISKKENVEYLLSRGSTAAKMAKTGARGNPSQLNQGTYAPLMAQDVKGNPIPVAITHSFVEGLSPAETFAMSFGGRASTVLSQLSTQKPGELFKRLTPTLFHEVVTIEDCKTHNGVSVPASDSLQVIGRFEASNGRLITEEIYGTLNKKGYIKIRSPLTCEAHQGVCQKCYGLLANGQLPPIGTNVGILASQSISETLTQAMLGTKHQGGVAGRQRNAYDEAANLLNNPKENFLDEATLATTHGLVTKITTDDLNNKNVFVEGTPHFVDRFQTVTVAPGDEVHVGQKISTGVVNTRKLASLVGNGPSRKSLLDSLREVYSRNTPLDPKHFEVVARNLVNYNKIINSGTTSFLPGDVVTVNDLRAALQHNDEEVPLSKAVNRTLSAYAGTATPGTKVTPAVAKLLKDDGITSVRVTTTGLETEPVVPGLQTAKLLDKNWVSKLAFSKLTRTIEDAVALHQKSPVHGYEPVTSYILGTEFGEGKNGQY
jgi:hypothetical protein